MKSWTLFLITCFLSSTPSFGALPVIINSGTPGATATCGPGGQVSNNLVNPIGNTIYDSYYTSECYYSTQSDHVILEPEIQAGTSYTLYLHFAETYFGSGNPGSGGDGSRIFHVDVEGTRILENMDIHFAIGPSNAIVFRYDFTATTNGSVTISFIPVNQNAKVSAIEIRPFNEDSDLPPTTSIIDLTSSAFPVEWLDQQIEADGDRFTLSWRTAWESNNKGFDIQVKPAGEAEAMTSIGFVEGAGDSQEPRQYIFTSDPLDPGPYLVRIVQRDFDGRYSFSPLLQVMIGSSDLASRIRMHPNPTDGKITVTVFANDRQEVGLTIYSIDGRRLFHIPADSFEQGVLQATVSLGTYPPGVYVIEAHSNEERVSRKVLLY